MKKFILSAILIISAVFGMNARDIALSLNAGVGTSTWVGDATQGTNPRFAYRVGLGVDVPIQGRFGFRTGLNFEQIGTNFDTDFKDVDLHTNQMYLEVPLMGTMRFGLKRADLVFNAGPYLGVGVGGKTTAAKGNTSVSAKTFDSDGEGLNRFDMGMGIGLGVEFDRFRVGIDTRYGFLHIIDDVKAYNIAMFVNFGYRF